MNSIISTTQTRQFYIALGLLMGLIAVTGFWPTYFGPLMTGTLSSPFVIHFHAVVFTGWLVLFVAQVAFAASGNVRLHIRFGRIGIGYGIGLIVVGLTTGVIRSRLADGSANAGLLLASISDMVVFAGFFFLAIGYRKKPEIHRRAMVVAATMLLIAAAGRLWFLSDFSTPSRLALLLLIWSSPVLCAIGYDVFRGRGVHIVYVAGLIAFVVRIASARLIVGTETWATIAENVLTFWGV